ncbi:sulfatase [Haloarcula marina]|uniref:sulfatase n=1 Tax=Haloarcula marina TaxID=2961574 RepID=UPI0020B6FCD7|nr:sulfatase [Halomicroarcula marina]
MSLSSDLDLDSPENIIILSLDCVRPEALSCYEDSFRKWKQFPMEPSTPYIDSIANAGARYSNAFCQAPFTPASHASILTGLNPYNHGIRQIVGQTLADDVTTVAEFANDAGYRTGAFIGAHALDSRYGFNSGFDIYDEDFETTADNWELGHRRPCEEVMDKGLNWLKQDENSPSLLFMHFFDAHDGELPTSDEHRVISATRRLLDPFDQLVGRPLEVKKGYGHRFHIKQTQRIDKQIGLLTDYLRESGQFEDTLIFLLADHGDAFGVHGEYNHRKFLFDVTTRIPFICKPHAEAKHLLEGITQDVNSDIVRTIDILPTIIDCLEGDNTSDSIDGLSLLNERPDEIYAYNETQFEKPGTNFEEIQHTYAALRGIQWKLVVDRQSGERCLYNLSDDPGEHNDVYEQNSQIAQRLENKLSELSPDEGNIDTEMSKKEAKSVSKRLEELGYM